MAMLAAFLMLNTNAPYTYIFSNQFTRFFGSKVYYSVYLFLVSIFLFYGAYIGFFTAFNHEKSFISSHLIEMAKESEKNGKCSKKIYDFGKGGIQFSQKYLGFSNYYKDQVITYGKLNNSDRIVLKWNLCASDELINRGSFSLELLNVHINVLSMMSILPGEIGKLTILDNKIYIDDWEKKLDLLLSIAPKRVDQATPLISFYLNNSNDKAVKRVCNKIKKSGFYQGFCDLALGAILLKEGNLKQGMNYINRANDNGVLDSTDIDKKTVDGIKKLLLIHKKLE